MNDFSDQAQLKLPPVSDDAERAVLGALLLANECYDYLGGLLVEQDFYGREHRAIWRALLALIETNKPADSISAGQWLKDRGLLEEAGGIEYLIGLRDGGTVANVRAYAEIVREKSIKRAVLVASLKMSDLVYAEAGRTARQTLDEAQALLAAVDERSHRGQGTFRALSEVFSELMQQLDDAAKSGTVPGVTSGFPDLDRTLNPMMPGQLIVVGARPAVGKTSLALNMALFIATHHKASVGMFSMEMTDIELAVRILSGYSGVPAGRFREHRLGEREWERINHTLATYHQAPIYIDQSGGLSIQELTARARVVSKQNGPFGLLIVDYLQLSRSEGKYDNRAVEIGAVTSGLKRLAKELQCPILALSQLNREAAKENKRPSIAELRDSGSIEADADTILLLHRPYVTSQKPEIEFDAEIIIGKQRNGQIGIVNMDYDARLTRFFDYGQAPGRRAASAGTSARDYSAAKGA